ncbi:hypothetical protein J3Q64DRAFT_1837244 [Phycomyces blakesleeanus]|uniref:Uncharacterized protein n=2 Tax=Phycomyces blakesleeanus TaxID=4837 RepID=A0A162TXW3_PHYB8|nr:hypothetical protein PHYBLDRAFT_148615 [Phycomyces blakesleeanus NRRL 1555(-)]OAD70703.1 hypothetical protein PHYBLDRAFT_148615 [Phycomyces blakesleeanus NRRL 1555(-)]|eukprot:XP_018288743.1 hypothetical protein PHYBLDRAFT_148615 [Phycomyces blakesleeanus NRRL 1555(-)]
MLSAVDYQALQLIRHILYFAALMACIRLIVESVRLLARAYRALYAVFSGPSANDTNVPPLLPPAPKDNSKYNAQVFLYS